MLRFNRWTYLNSFFLPRKISREYIFGLSNHVQKKLIKLSKVIGCSYTFFLTNSSRLKTTKAYANFKRHLTGPLLASQNPGFRGSLKRLSLRCVKKGFGFRKKGQKRIYMYVVAPTLSSIRQNIQNCFQSMQSYKTGR